VRINNKVFILLVSALACLAVLMFVGNFFPAAISNTSVLVSPCSTDADCGINGLLGSPSCQGNNVYQNYITYTCNDPGTVFSSCASSTAAQLQTTCASSQACSNGNCATVGGGGGGWYYPTVLTPTVPPEQETIPPIANQPIALAPTIPPKTTPTPAAEIIPETSVNLLPLAIANLSAKIPLFKSILDNLRITNAEDVVNLKNYNIFLPGIKEITGSDFLNLSPEQKNTIPTDVVFVLLGNSNIDAMAKLDFSKNALNLQTVNVLPAKPIRLVVKPESGAKEASGYVLFTAPNFPNPEQNFSILKFSYNDDDKDGIYVSDISTPAVEGQYQIVTSVNYGATSREIRTTTLVDPDGYIYEKVGDKELRINNAIVSLYKLNDKKQYELWSAGDYGQENPQITDSTGNYSFLVPEGVYYLTVKSPGYYFYQGDAVSVKEGKEIHANIALKKQFDLYSLLDRNTILIIILFCFVGYNFYWNRKRESIKIKK